MDITGDPHEVVVIVAVVRVADGNDVTGTTGGVVKGDVLAPHELQMVVGGVAGVPLGGGGVPRCRGDVLVATLAPPVLCDVSAAFKLRTAGLAVVVVVVILPPGTFFFVPVLLDLPGGTRGTVPVTLFATGTLNDPRDRLLVIGPARDVIGGVLSGVLLLLPPAPPNDGDTSVTDVGDGRGGKRTGFDAQLFSRGTLCDRRLRGSSFAPAWLVVVGGVTDGLLVVVAPPYGDIRG